MSAKIKNSESSEESVRKTVPLPKRPIITKEKLLLASAYVNDSDNDEFEYEIEDEDIVGEDEDDEETDNEYDNDFFILKTYKKRQARLNEGTYSARIGEITGKEEYGEYGSWKKLTIPFEIDTAYGRIVTVNFIVGSSMNPDGRLYPIIKGILCKEPPENFDIRQIQGTKVTVEIRHNINEKGDVWEQVVSAAGITVKRK